MPRRSTKGQVTPLFADIAPMTPTQLAAAANQRSERLMASVRGDMAGAPLNLLTHPQTYQARVLKVWEAYSTDALFKRMVDRTVEFTANGFRWEVPTEATGESWIDRLKDWLKVGKRADREEDVWAHWSQTINKDVPGVVPGLDEIIRWAAKHLLLSGMFVPHWEYGTMRFGKQDFKVPVRMTCYPASVVTLLRTNQFFEDERAFLRLPKGAKGLFIQEGEQREATPASVGAGQMELPTIKKPVDNTATFVLKYGWSPGDLVTFRRGQYHQTGQAVYPTIPFIGLLPQFAIRQKLFAADLAILDGIINYIVRYSIGDKDHPPVPPIIDKNGNVTQEGTIAQVKRLIQEGRGGPGMELFLPYYVNVDILSMDPKTLVNEAKYVQSTIEILQGFGLLFARSASGSRERMERINLSNWEMLIDTLRSHIGAFLQTLATNIVEMNEGKFRATPRWSPNPLSTKSEQFLDGLMQLAKLGRVSARTLLRYHGLDDAVEIGRIANEQGVDVDDLMNANVPLSYKQTVSQPDYGGSNRDPEPSGPAPKKRGRTRTTETETSITPTMQTGRPRGRRTES